MNKNWFSKKLWSYLGTWLLTLWLAYGPLQTQALAWNTKESIKKICDLEPEAWLELYTELDNNFNKWDNIFVLYKVCSWDWWWYIMVPEKYSKKKHWKFDLYWYNSQEFLWNEPYPIKWESWAVFMADKWARIPATWEFYVVIVDDYVKSEKELEKISASLSKREFINIDKDNVSAELSKRQANY